MKHLTILFLSFTLLACGNDKTPTPKAIQPESIFVLIENGGSVPAHEQDAATNAALNLFQQLTTISRRSATRHAQIQIILSARPNRITWSGTPRQLLEQANEVMQLVQFTQGFSDLGMSFAQIDTTINLTRPERVRLYWIGPVIDVPFQEVSGAIEIALPQAIPTLALPSFLEELTHLKIYGVHADQRPMLQAYLQSHGVLKRAREGSLDFTLNGAAETKASLNDLL